jgi:DNA-binding transcriptional regulator WhiA
MDHRPGEPTIAAVEAQVHSRRIPRLHAAEAKPSFSSEVRHELALLVPARECCQLSELRGIAAAAADLAPLPGDALSLRLTLNSAVRKVVRLARLRGISGEGGADPSFHRGPTHLRPTYRVVLDVAAGAPGAALTEPPRVVERPCCRRAFLRGAFLVAGVVNRGASGYHLEFELAGEAQARTVAATLRSMEAPAHVRHRRRWAVYLKGTDAIAMTLAAMGASQAVLHWEDTRIVREVRGRANRVANSETANLRRSVESGLRQVQAARGLARRRLLDAQPAAIREVAHARMTHPAASLQQLAEHLSLSRSAVNQRLRRLVDVAVTRGLID